MKGHQELSKSYLCEVKTWRSLELSGSKNVVIQYKNYLCGSGSVGDGAITASVHQTANSRVHKTTTYSTSHETPQHLQLTLKSVNPSVKTHRVLSHGSVPKISGRGILWSGLVGRVVFLVVDPGGLSQPS